MVVFSIATTRTPRERRTRALTQAAAHRPGRLDADLCPVTFFARGVDVVLGLRTGVPGLVVAGAPVPDRAPGARRPATRKTGHRLAQGGSRRG